MGTIGPAAMIGSGASGMTGAGSEAGGISCDAPSETKGIGVGISASTGIGLKTAGESETYSILTTSRIVPSERVILYFIFFFAEFPQLHANNRGDVQNSKYQHHHQQPLE